MMLYEESGFGSCSELEELKKTNFKLLENSSTSLHKFVGKFNVMRKAVFGMVNLKNLKNLKSNFKLPEKSSRTLHATRVCAAPSRPRRILY